MQFHSEDWIKVKEVEVANLDSFFFLQSLLNAKEQSFLWRSEMCTWMKPAKYKDKIKFIIKYVHEPLKKFSQAVRSLIMLMSEMNCPLILNISKLLLFCTLGSNSPTYLMLFTGWPELKAYNLNYFLTKSFFMTILIFKFIVYIPQ